MKILRVFSLLLITISAIACASTPVSSSAAKVTGLYSDMRYNAEGGDVLGMEILVVQAQGGYYVVYQSSDGDPSVPVVIPVEVSGMALKFDVPASVDARGSFTGHVNARELAGIFHGSQESVVLKRGRSYWQ